MKSPHAVVRDPAAVPEQIGLRLMPVGPGGAGGPGGSGGKGGGAGGFQGGAAEQVRAAREAEGRSVTSKSPTTNRAGRNGTKSRGNPAGKASRLALTGAEKGVRTYVLDTNVLLHNPKSLFVFQENNVVIPFTVLEELDKFKGVNNEIGRNARECIRFLDRLRDLGDLTEGVNLGDLNEEGETPDDGAVGSSPRGTLRVVIAREDMPPALAEDTPDHRIIAVAWNLLEKGEPAVFVSKDINARIKADALGIHAEDFENQKVNVDELYTGYVTLRCEGGLIDELYSERMLAVERLAPAMLEAEKAAGATEPRVPGVTDDRLKALSQSGGAAEEGDDEAARKRSIDALLQPNQYVILIDQAEDGHTGLARRLADTGHVIPVTQPRKPTFGIMARNVQQTMALDLLLDDEVRMVTLIGAAGTGKTLLAVAAGMSKVFTDGRYEKLLVARPIMPMGRDIGYLPGDKDEKLTAWMQPIFDNLAYLLSTRGAPNQNAESHTTEQRVQKLIADGRLVLEPLTYIRGRSIPHQFIIIDEAQNLSPHEVKTIVSRVGEGTKIIFTGDIEQIDHPYLDASSNGLTYAVEKMKGAGVVGHVTLARSERSSLASLATERL